MKIDKRKKLGIVFDSETIGTPENFKALQYDIAYVVRDKKGNIYKKVNHLIAEIWNNEKLMLESFFNQKIPMYKKMVQNKQIDVIPFAEIVKEMQQDFKKYNAQYFSAYNVGFDLVAFYETACYIYPQKYKYIPMLKYQDERNYSIATKFFEKYILHQPIKIIDIWTKACETLCQQKTFQTFYKKITPKGFIKSNAEIVYNYVNDSTDFIEDHTALSDTLIESEILARIDKTGKSKIDWICKPYTLIRGVV